MKEIRQDFSQLREEWNSEHATWQNKGETEMNEVNDRLIEEWVARLVEDRVTKIQAAAKNSIQKVNIEIKSLREQLAAIEVTDGTIPNEVLPVMAGDVENSIQSILDSANSAGNYHMASGNANNLLPSVCGNATPQPSVNSIAGSAVLNVASDVFANNPLYIHLLYPFFMTARRTL